MPRETSAYACTISATCVYTDSTCCSVYYYAGVSKESVYQLNQCLLRICEEFAALQRKNPNVEMQPSPIYLHINSYGGGETVVY